MKKLIEVDSDWVTATVFTLCLFASIISLVVSLSRYVSGVFILSAVTWTNYVLSAVAFVGIVAFRPVRVMQIISDLLFLASSVPILMQVTKASGEMVQLGASGLALLRVVLGIVLVSYFIHWFRKRVRLV